jgi:hypothetical protein
VADGIKASSPGSKDACDWMLLYLTQSNHFKMKIRIALGICILMTIGTRVMAQSVGINTTTPDSSAILDIQSVDKGLLMPRMSTAQRIAIPNPATGLMVYDTGTQSFWFYRPTGWVNTMSNVPDWCTNGNSVSGTDFIGTTNNQPLVFKTNNVQSGKIDNTYENAFLGCQAGLSNTSGNKIPAWVMVRCILIPSGSDNTAFGYQSLFSNTFGSSNVPLE